MLLTSETIHTIGLDPLVADVAAVYQRKDELRSIWDIWLHTNHHAAGVAEEIRKEAFGPRLIEELAHFTVWLFTIAEKLRGEIGVPKYETQTERETVVRVKHSLSDILWNKYPGLCPLCHWRRTSAPATASIASLDLPCDCLLHVIADRTREERRRHVKDLREYARQTSDRQPATVDQWQAMLGSIFADHLRRLNPKDFAMHLLEEVGEVSDAIARLYTYRNENFAEGEPSWRQAKLEDEFADMTSRLFTLVERLNLSREHSRWQIEPSFFPIRVSNIVWKHYGSDTLRSIHCPFCHNVICDCPLVLIPESRSVEEVKERTTGLL